MQPRHFHAGPNPPAASDSDATAVALPPVARLYRHALESIFAFLRQGELVVALQVSRGWLAAVKSMSSLQLRDTVVNPSASLFVVAMSALGRHTIELIGSYYNPLQLTVDTLLMLAWRASCRSFECCRANYRCRQPLARCSFPSRCESSKSACTLLRRPSTPRSDQLVDCHCSRS